MEDSKNEEVGKCAFIGGGSMHIAGRSSIVGDPPESLSGGAIGDGGTARYDRLPGVLDRYAERLLADETFLDLLCEKVAERLSKKGTESAIDLYEQAQRALEKVHRDILMARGS